MNRARREDAIIRARRGDAMICAVVAKGAAS